MRVVDGTEIWSPKQLDSHPYMAIYDLNTLEKETWTLSSVSTAVR